MQCELLYGEGLYNIDKFNIIIDDIIRQKKYELYELPGRPGVYSDR
jgi:hypothetical protein